jgi:hypothetical protein
LVQTPTNLDKIKIKMSKMFRMLMSTTSLNYTQIVSSLIDNRKNIKPKRGKIGKYSWFWKVESTTFST